MYGKMIIGLVAMALAGTVIGGCKKETPEKPAVPEQAKESAAAPETDAKSGEALFKKHCAACHPQGGNIINPQKTLKRQSRETNGIKTAEDLISNMRNPGPGMTKFDETVLPEQDAKAIAEYVLEAFK